MNKEKIMAGNDAVITQRIYGHQFKIGERVEVVKANPVKDSYICLDDDLNMYACTSDEIEKLVYEE